MCLASLKAEMCTLFIETHHTTYLIKILSEYQKKQQKNLLFVKNVSAGIFFFISVVSS